MEEKIINKSISVDEFEKLLKDKSFIVIDIRTIGELEYFGYINGMDLNLDVYKKEDIDKLLGLDKNKKYLIYCYHGNRSGVLIEIMKEHGFKYVIDLAGGTDAWTRAGKKLVEFKK